MIQTAEIKSSHNIVISFPYGGLFERIAASIIDIALMSIYTMLMSAVFEYGSSFWFIFVFPVIGAYHLICEIYNKGQSIGKKILKLRVVSMDGRSPTSNQYLLRWMFRMLDITFSIGSLGILFIISTERKQRLGDIIGQTLVVSISNKQFVSLDTLQNLEIKDEEIRYPSISYYSDQDMLLVKESLRRYATAKNPANRQMIINLSDSIAAQLKIKIENGGRIEFLKRALYEYILLTR